MALEEAQEAPEQGVSEGLPTGELVALRLIPLVLDTTAVAAVQVRRTPLQALPVVQVVEEPGQVPGNLRDGVNIYLPEDRNCLAVLVQPGFHLEARGAVLPRAALQVQIQALEWTLLGA